MTTDLVLARGEGLSKALAWSRMTAGDRRTRATAACHERNSVELWDLTEAYLLLHGNQGTALSSHTQRNYRSAINRLIKDWLDEDLRKPRPDAAAAWLRTLQHQGIAHKDGRTTGMKAATLGIHLAAVRTLYAALRWTGTTIADPFKDVHRPRDPVPAWEKRRPYSKEEMKKVLAHAEGPHRTMVLLGAHAGLRAAEMMDLLWNDVDLKRREVVVQHGKGDKKRTVPLTGTLTAQLDRTPVTERVGRVLPWPDRFKAHYEMKMLARRAGVPALGLHALRHYAGTMVVSMPGGSMETAARMLGHQQIETTRVYVAWSDESLRDVLKDL